MAVNPLILLDYLLSIYCQSALSVPALDDAFARLIDNFARCVANARLSAGLELNALRQKISNSLSDVNTYLSYGWNGLFDELDHLDLDIDFLKEIWQDFHSFLLQTRDGLLKLHKRLELWRKLFYLVLFFSFFSEFPNSFRHLCTTMPWTIWPALVVLWGVCWMFYGPGDVALGESTDLLCNEYVFDPSLDFDLFMTEQSDTMHSTLLAEPDFLDFEFQQSLTAPTDDTGMATTFPAIVTTGLTPKTYSTVTPQAIEKRQPQAGSAAVSTFTISSSSQGYRPQSGVIESRRPEAESAASPTASISLFHQGNPPQGAPVVCQQTELLRSDQGRMVCKYEGCESLTFNSEGEWKKHTDEHKPFHCTECEPEQRFAKKCDLQRHQRSKHSCETSFFCDESGCERSQAGSKGGFKRKDHLRQHIREVHKLTLEPKPQADQPVAQSSLKPTPGPVAPLQQESKKRKRVTELAFFTTDELTDKLLEEQRKSQRLQQELESERERHKEREDRLLRIIEALTGHERS